jgi:hypothetical protein
MNPLAAIRSASCRNRGQRAAPADMTQSSRPLLGFWLCVFLVTPPTCSASKCVPLCGPSDIHFTLANKGVGPAIIRHVIVRVDGQPVRNWREALEKILGPGSIWVRRAT